MGGRPGGGGGGVPPPLPVHPWHPTHRPPKAHATPHGLKRLGKAVPGPLNARQFMHQLRSQHGHDRGRHNTISVPDMRGALCHATPHCTTPHRAAPRDATPRHTTTHCRATPHQGTPHCTTTPHHTTPHVCGALLPRLQACKPTLHVPVVWKHVGETPGVVREAVQYWSSAHSATLKDRSTCADILGRFTENWVAFAETAPKTAPAYQQNGRKIPKR